MFQFFVASNKNPEIILHDYCVRLSSSYYDILKQNLNHSKMTCQVKFALKTETFGQIIGARLKSGTNCRAVMVGGHAQSWGQGTQ